MSVIIGKSVGGNITCDVKDLGVFYIYGSIGSGKSVFLGSIINQLLPLAESGDIELYVYDVKRVEFANYRKFPYINVFFDDASMKIREILYNTSDKQKILIIDEFAELFYHDPQIVDEFFNAKNTNIIFASQVYTPELYKKPYTRTAIFKKMGQIEYTEANGRTIVCNVERLKLFTDSKYIGKPFTISQIQRELCIGYVKASEIIDELLKLNEIIEVEKGHYIYKSQLK